MGSRKNTESHAAVALLSALCFICCASEPVHASCFSELLGGDAPFDDQIEHDPKMAITRIGAALAGTAAAPGAGVSRAHLYAMLMDADQNAGEIGAARDAAARGLDALTAADGDTLRRRLQLTGIMLLEVQGHIEQAAAEYEKAAANIPDGAPDLACVLGDRGYLRYLVGGRVDAAVDAMRAYRLAGALGRDKIRLSAGQLLARLYSQYGLYDEALKLANEAVEFLCAFVRQDAVVGRLSISRRRIAEQRSLRGCAGGLSEVAGAVGIRRRSLCPIVHAAASVYGRRQNAGPAGRVGNLPRCG
jgi:tetratricopeptide (TPR) repeat protein